MLDSEDRTPGGPSVNIIMNIIMKARYLLPNFRIRAVGTEDFIRFKHTNSLSHNNGSGGSREGSGREPT